MRDRAASPRRPRLVARALGWLLASLLRLLAATWRRDTAACARLATESGAPRRLLGFWHGKYFALFALLRGIRGSVLIGGGFRGEVIAAICEELGFAPILLPRGDAALGGIRAAFSGQALCATPLDGPLGPARRVKRALIRAAAETGTAIVPLSVVSSPTLVLSRRWDRRELPLPFARVSLRIGEPLAIPEAASGDALEQWRSRVAAHVDELERAPL